MAQVRGGSRQVPGVAATVLAAVLTAACGAPPEGIGPGADPDAITGELEVRIVDHFDGTSARSHHLVRPGERPLRLRFERDPELPSGTRLAVWREAVSGGDGPQVNVARWQALAPPSDELDERQHAIVGAPPFPKRKLAFVLVDLGDGVNLTVAQARQRAFGMAPGDQSMKQVLLEYSFGRFDLEGEVIGPLATTMTGCDEDGVAERLRPMLPAGFDNIVWYLGQRVPACGWAGVAPLGRNGRIGGQLWVNGTASCRVATHEFGHNLGLQHAARLRCPGAPLLDDPTRCTSSEYGDSADVMGDGCNHFNGYSKSYLTWFEGCNGALARGSATFTLLPVETACNGVQVLLVPMPKPRRMGSTDLENYVLELRAPIGLDARFSPPVVMVRLAAPLAQMRSARMTWILDMNPATPAVDGLRAGDSFTDPAGGVSFRVETLATTSASVKVELAADTGAPTCLDGSPFTPPGLASCGEGPPPATPSSIGVGAPPGGSGPAGSGGAAGAADERATGGAEPPARGDLAATWSGCGCRLGGGGATSAAWLALAALIVAGARRRAQPPRGGQKNSSG